MEDLAEGKGTEYLDGGAVYFGDFVGGKKQGEGEIEFADGSVYHGDFLDDKFHGYGELKTQSYRYKGGWREGQKSGLGEYYWKSGARYIGNYEADEREGYGEYIFPDGRVIEGCWRRGSPLESPQPERASVLEKESGGGSLGEEGSDVEVRSGREEPGFSVWKLKMA